MSNYSQDLIEKFSQEKQHRDQIAFVDEIDSFAMWNEENNYWKITPMKEFREYCFHWLKDNVKGNNITSAAVKDFTQLAKWQIYKKIDRINTPYISFKNKIFNTQTFRFEEPSNDIPSFLYQDYETNKLKSKTPRWDKFLREVLVDKDGQTDERLIKYLYEVLGYLLVPEIKGHAMFYLIGEGQNGKSVLLKLMTEIIGTDFVAANTIESLTTKDFILPSLIGKRVNICSEEESKYVQADKFKALITGDPIETRRLYGEPFTFTPTVKFIFAANKVPRFNDWDGGIERRVRIIPFNYNVPEYKKDTDLINKLRTEIPGIVGKIIRQGLEPIVSRGFKFVTPRSVNKITAEFKKNTAPLETFIESAFSPKPKNGEPVKFYTNKQLYEMYRVWTYDTGKKPVSSRKFLMQFDRVYPKVKKDRQYDDGTGKQERGRFVAILESTENLMEI